jgi:hypothetical protein
MKNGSNGLDEAASRQLLVAAAKRAVMEQGYSLTRLPGRGLASVWNMRKKGKSQVAAIRTTRDRWIAFQPLDDGAKWKTLDDVELVVVAALDSKDQPKNIEVYIFPAAEVRKRFDASFAARTADGQFNKDGYGMWVALDPDPRGIAASTGSGIVEKYKPLAVYPIAAVRSGQTDRPHVDASSERTEEVNPPGEPSTIAEVMAWARERVAQIAGVRIDAVKLDLKVEY